MASSEHERSVYAVKLSDEAARYEELIEFMEKVSVTGTEELTVEERRLVSVACKNVSDTHLDLRRIITSVEQKQSPSIEDHVSVINDYRSKIEKELSDICDKVSNLTIKGFLAEFKSGAEREESSDEDSSESVLHIFGEIPPNEELDVWPCYEKEKPVIADLSEIAKSEPDEEDWDMDEDLDMEDDVDENALMAEIDAMYLEAVEAKLTAAYTKALSEFYKKVSSRT